MALSHRYNGLERRDILLTESRFNIYSKENSVRQLLGKIEGDPTVGSKDMELSNRYSSLERLDLLLTEWRLNIYTNENSVRKLV
jgi:hypothetical protein